MEHILDIARLRFLSESLESSALEKAGKHLDTCLGPSPIFEASAFPLPQEKIVLAERLYPAGDDGFYYIDKNNGAIFYFNTDGEIVNEVHKRNFFDFGYSKQLKKIMRDSNAQVLTKARGLDLLGENLVKHIQNHPEFKLTFLGEVINIYSDNFEAEDSFKVGCYSRGANVVLDFSHKTHTCYGEFKDILFGRAYQRSSLN